jgi:hypothetical protein
LVVERVQEGQQQLQSVVLVVAVVTEAVTVDKLEQPTKVSQVEMVMIPYKVAVVELVVRVVILMLVVVVVLEFQAT